MEMPGNPHRPGAQSPLVAVRRPHAGIILGSLVALLAFGCESSSGSQVTSPDAVGMTDTMAPYYTDGQTTLYEVQTPVHLPIRAPNGTLPTGSGAPFPNAPFVAASDIRTEIRYTISNLDNAKHTVELLIDPWNEFVRYKPGIQIVSDEQTTPDLSGFDKFFVLEPKARIQGTLTPDDTRELAVDLATCYNINANPPMGMNGMPDTTNGNALFNHVMSIQNRSNGYDPLIAPYIPKVIPGMIGFDLGLRTEEQANIAVEVQVDVTDLSDAQNRVIQPGSSDAPMAMPTTLLQPPKVVATGP